ncbi:MAG: YraN family protein [Candidatus Nanopelagicaceae bacterium]|nr:YraN family protein [Candidatus Nanopelagicaceae bacterium]
MALTHRSKTKNRTLGALGEKAVAEFLINRGSLIVDRNWRIKEGEIDIIATLPDETLAFVEVKTRTSLAFGHPLEAITREKAHRMQRLALAWLATHQCLGSNYQVDCAAVLVSIDGSFSIEYREKVL